MAYIEEVEVEDTDVVGYPNLYKERKKPKSRPPSLPRKPSMKGHKKSL
jgi:hypothetical protein